MIDWTESMEQTFEYYEVDPVSWKDIRKLDNITSCTIKYDNSAETLGSANISMTDTVGESYVRIYLIAVQNGFTDRRPLGTFLIQTPSSSFDGKVRTVSVDAYTPLLELKENPPELGYTLLKGENILQNAYVIIKDKCRATVVRTISDKTLNSDFVANTSDTWLTYCRDLLSQAKYVYDIDTTGRILFAPKQDVETLQPVYTFDDGNSSILYPEVSMTHDLYGIPNVVEVVCSSSGSYMYSKAVNDDTTSPTSTVNRGRKIIKRITDPELAGIPTQEQLDEYAETYLKTSSSVEYQITFTHGYCPVRVNDCIRLNYTRAGLQDVKAKIISQSIKCEAGCSIQTTAVFTKKLWK